MNISSVSDDSTARTCLECAQQRAENLSILGAKSVLELCVGPSLEILELSYQPYEIQVTGNDIDSRWKRYYPKGKWIIGDALKIDYSNFDAIVFAPPLSRGCTGKRQDALMIDQVQPSYNEFISKTADYPGIIVLVLPGRSLASAQDRKQYFKLMNGLSGASMVPLRAGRRETVKYYDIYLQRIIK